MEHSASAMHQSQQHAAKAGQPWLQLESIGKRFGSFQALQDVAPAAECWPAPQLVQYEASA